jgi:hypothetical protein
MKLHIGVLSRHNVQCGCDDGFDFDLARVEQVHLIFESRRIDGWHHALCRDRKYRRRGQGTSVVVDPLPADGARIVLWV